MKWQHRNAISLLLMAVLEVHSLQLELHPKKLAFAGPCHWKKSRCHTSHKSIPNTLTPLVNQNQKYGRASVLSASVSPPEPKTTNLPKRERILNFLGLNKKSVSADVTESKTEVPVDAGPFEVTTLEDLEDHFNDARGIFRKKGKSICAEDVGDGIDYKALMSSLSVKGDTQMIGSPEHKGVVHPVVQLLHERRRRIESDGVASSVSNPQNVTRIMPPEDGFRIALAVEGGGMRGCVTAGMVSAIHYLGLENTVDVVYGASAGTVIGAYFITRQLPWYGPEVYYDSLTTAGRRFINGKRFLRAIGIGLVDPRLVYDVVFRRNHGKPVLDLSYLLKSTMQEDKPLNWEVFEDMQKVQPLKIMASGLRSERAVTMDMERGSFRNIKEMANCMRASCLLPGVAGPLVNMGGAVEKDSLSLRYTMTPGNNFKDKETEPMADSLLFSPIPFSGAIAEGEGAKPCTHVVVLRSRPDGVDVTGAPPSFFEKLILKRFFLRKNKLKNIYKYMTRSLHKKRYAEQVIILNEAARDMERSYEDISKPHLLPIAVPPGSPEVGRLETGREEIFEGVRRGFARAFDALVEDSDQRGNGEAIARQVFPDEILEYDPRDYVSDNESAFAMYVQKMKGEGVGFPENLGKTAKEAGSPR